MLPAILIWGIVAGVSVGMCVVFRFVGAPAEVVVVATYATVFALFFVYQPCLNAARRDQEEDDEW